MSYVSQQSKLFGFSVPLYPADSYTGVITNVPEDATEILSLKGEMIDFTNITQFSDIVLHSDNNYSVRIRREDTYIHLEILEVSTNQTAVLWWTGFGSNYKWWICASINDSDGNIYLFAVSDTNHTWVNRGTSDHTPISGVSSSGLLIKRFFKYTQISGGGAGSGYIGNSLVSNKKMVGYNVPTSEDESTKTESVEDASESPVSGKPKIGNGYAKIKFLRDNYQVFNLIASSDMKDSNGISPVINSGGGTYSESNGYWCSSTTNIKYPLSLNSYIMKGSGYIDIEGNGKNNNGAGDGNELSVQLRDKVTGSAFGTFRVVCVFANGYADRGQASNMQIIRLNADSQYNWYDTDGAPLDLSQYQNDWHDLKFRIHLENSVVTKLEVYIDGTLWGTHIPSNTVSFSNISANLEVIVCCIDNSGYKSIEITRYFTD